MSTKHLIRTLLAAVALLAKLQEGEATGADALPVEQRTQLCAVAEEMATIAPAVATHATEILNQEAERLRTVLKLRIYIQQQTGKKAMLTTVLEQAYTGKCKTSLGTLRKEVATGAAFVDAAAYLAGRIGEALDFLADIHQSGGSAAGCLSTADGRKVVEGRTGVKNCGKERKATATPTTMPATELTSQGFTKLTSTVGNTKVGHGTALCHVLSTSTKTGINDQAVAGRPTIVDGYVTLPASGSAFTLEDLTDLRANNKQAQAPHFTAAFNAKTAYKQVATMACDASAMTINDIKNAAEARELFWRLLQNGTGKYDDTTTGEQVKKEIETAFQPATTFAKTWLEPALKNKVAKEAAGEEGSGHIELENKKDIDKLHRILNYYTGLAIKRELMATVTGTGSNPACTSEAKPSKKTPTKEDCKEHTEKDACQNAGCKFDGSKSPKCFPEPESKTEKQDEGNGKPTSASTCADKEQKDCKSPDCKWENNACKDSSILVNKKFAVMTASFASLVKIYYFKDFKYFCSIL
uniref:Variant surface glycoprotein 1125.1712 n=1 Tax=Trypanosoma brucei TaxID=5691 RepID=A0A1J0R7K7_9TRYP|nr:variant surface glycoprotein 1125.1712 [Trypanosoma brucei]